MDIILCLAVLLCSGYQYVQTLSLPTYIKPCPRNDPNFDKCALENGRDAISQLIQGDQEYGIPVMDPWYHRNITASEFGLTVSAVDMTIKGFREGQLESFKTDFEEESVTLEYRVPRIQFKGNYSISGRLVAIPINGAGPFEANMTNVIVRYISNFQTKKKEDGQEYGIPEKYQMVFIPEGMKFIMENIFGQNKQINDALNKFFNENWKIVMREAGRPITNTMGHVFNDLLKDLGEKIPISEVFSK